MSFEKILSHPSIHSFLSESNITNPTFIQTLVIPDFIKGKSVNVIAKTGSGKTLCFALPICELLKEAEENRGVVNPKDVKGKPRAVILAPTRELAGQLQSVFKKIAHHAKLRVRMLGGGEAAKNNHLLSRAEIDVLIATPGRLSSALKKKELNLKETNYLIMDEADQLLEMGFKKDLENIYTSCDPELVHVGLFSATRSTGLEEFCRTLFVDVDFAKYNSEDQNKVTQKVRTFNIYLKDNEKNKMTEAFIKNQASGDGIIFVNKHQTVEHLKEVLVPAFPKVKIHTLHGEMEALDRKKSYNKFLKEGGILIATDIVARGMDIENLKWVMNYDLPFEAVYYIHRCGRVGRRQEDGFVYNLVTPKDLNIIGRINEAIKNQTAIKLTAFDEKKFAAVKAIKAKAEKTKLERKKKQLTDLTEKISEKKSEKFKKHAKTIKHVNTPRYKRDESKNGAKKKEAPRSAKNAQGGKSTAFSGKVGARKTMTNKLTKKTATGAKKTIKRK